MQEKNKLLGLIPIEEIQEGILKHLKSRKDLNSIPCLVDRIHQSPCP